MSGKIKCVPEKIEQLNNGVRHIRNFSMRLDKSVAAIEKRDR